MFVSNMKILTLNSQQNVSLSSPTNQQQIVQPGGGNGGGGGSSSKEFTSNHGGGSTQKSSKRDQHQKHNGGPNKSKFMHGNGNNNKIQLPQQQLHQQQKYHHNSNSSKNKKQHYNGNNNSTSSLNRKKYYQQQQQQNALTQLHYHQQQQQYISAMHLNQQKTQSATTPTNNNNNNTTNTSNNNSHLVKNQNYTNMDLLQNPIGKNNICCSGTVTPIPHTNNTSSTIADTCNCSIQNNDCDHLSSTESQYQPQLHNNISYDTTHQRSSISSAITTHTSNSASVPLSPLSKFTKVPQTTAANIKANKNKKISVSANSTNLQDFIEPEGNNCNCGPSSSGVHSVNPHSTTTLIAPNSKKKSLWKSSNISCGVGGGGVGGGGVAGGGVTCSMSPKLSNDKAIVVADKFGTKRCECNCNSISLNNTTSATVCDTFISSQQKQLQKEVLRNTAAMTTAFLSGGSTSAITASNNSSTTPPAGDISSTDNLFISSPTSKQKYNTNPPLTIEISQRQNNETGSKMVAASSNANGSIISLDSNPGKAVDTTTSTRHSASGLSSPNSYSLDFLHSVGVQMTGSVKLDATSGTGNNMRTVTGTSSYGSHATENSPVRGPYPYSGITLNQRQQRYVFGGGGSGNPYQQQQQQHHHHHHHQPTQLTIASFLQKDMLGEGLLSSSTTCTTTNGTSNSGQNNNGGSSNYSDQQTNHQQHYTRPHQHARYYNNYYQTHYYQHPSQQPGHLQSYGYGGNGGSVGGDLGRIPTNAGNHRPVYSGYLNYHTAGTGANNSLQYHNHLQQNQEQSRTRMSQSSCGGGGSDGGNLSSKKSSHGSCSSASSCSSSSSSSVSASSNSSCGSHRKQQQSTMQNQQKPLSNLNLAIETLPSKSNSQQGGNQRSHRSHHTHHGHGGGHHHHQNHHGHHHHQHVMANTPTTPQHQNYYNLTYVSTDGHCGGSNGSSNGTNSRGCSPAPQSLPSTPSSSTNSPKSIENCPGPVPVAMMSNLQLNTGQLNYPRYPNNQQSTSQQFQHFQQQNYLNKTLLTPLTLSMPSPSPSPTPSHVGGTLPPQQPPLGPHNIICCSQLDEASTAAAAAAAKTGIIAGNDYDSDASSTHSSGISNTAPHRKYQTLKSLSMSSTLSSSATSLSTTAQQLHDCQSQTGTPADVSSSTTPLGSPLDYTYAASAVHSFPNIQAASNSNHQQPQILNQAQLVCKAASNSTAATQLPHVYHNGVISLLNLPNQSPNNCDGGCSNYLDDDYHQQRQQPHFFLTSSSAQSSAEQLNAVSALSVATSRSNSSSGYWSPSHQCNFLYHQLSSGPATLMGPNTPSCGSSSSSISPSLPDRGDELRQQQQLNKPFPSSGSSSPSTCSSCLNEQHGTTEGGNSNNSSSSNSSVSVRSSAFVTSSERGSTQLLTSHQQRLIAQQTQNMCSSSLALSNSSASTVSSAQRTRNTGNGRNQQYLQNHSLMTSSSTNGGGTQQQVLPHMFPHQQLQSLPPPPPPHNLLYNNTQAHHLRALGNSSVHDFFTHTPPDRFLARAHLIEAKEEPTSLLNNSKWDNLSQDIWKKFISSQQTEETFKQKMRLWRYLYLFIKNAYPRYGLYLVGSTISGFGADTSDVDMCLVSRSASNIDPRMEALFNLTVLRDCLGKSGEFEYFNLIEAKVPILRFRDRVHQLEVDLNFNNCVGIKNTHLLYCYSQLDWRLRPLVLVTKLWAQHNNINNAKNMTISSYSLVLMVIHFLQYAVNPPVLPCLHDMFPDKFPLLRSNDFGYVDMNETIGPHESKNNQAVGELFLHFLEYYSRFDYSQHAISVRTGGVLPISVCRTAKSLKNDIHQWKELCIEEPFDLTNTARSVYDYETFERVKAVFVSSWHILQDSLDLNSLFLPFIDTSTAPSEQTSATSNAAIVAATNYNDMTDDFKHSIAAGSANIRPKVATDNRTLLWAEDRRVIDSSDNSQLSTKHIAKYSDTKHVLAHFHKEMQYETKASICRDISNPSPPTFTTMGSAPSSSTSFNGKHLNRSNSSTAALIS